MAAVQRAREIVREHASQLALQLVVVAKEVANITVQLVTVIV